MRELLALGAVGVSLVLGLAAAPADEGRDVVTRFADPDILESSGLVVDGDLAVTVNDSGDSSRIFTVDLGSGRTVGSTTWAAESTDNEALAPAGPGEVWVADIGDNARSREQVTVTRVPYGTGEQSVPGESYDLVYPGRGAADAEALLSHPVTGRLYLVTKGLTGGTVYAVPSALSADGPNRLAELGGAPPLVTGGAFLPDGEHLVVRDYGRAYVLGFPDLEEAGAFPLPEQEQGEALAVGDEEELYLSSEGARAPLLRVGLPDDVREAMAEPEPDDPVRSPPPTVPPEPGSGAPAPPDSIDEIEVQAWKWIAVGLVGTVSLVALVLSLRPR